MDRWVKTTNGQNFADGVGVKEPPMSLEESLNGVIKQVRDTHLFYLENWILIAS